MSIESAKAFLDRMRTDKEFAQKVVECKDAAARHSFVKSAGFDFSKADVDSVHAEISDEELDAINGGAVPSFMCGWMGYN